MVVNPGEVVNSHRANAQQAQYPCPSKMTKEEPLAYNTNLRAPIYTEVNPTPKARVHSREWQKIMNAEPVEINPSVGYGYKVCLVFV